MHTVYWTSFDSKIGTIYVASTSRGVCKITIPGNGKRDFMQWLSRTFANAEIVESQSQNRQMIDEIKRYLDQKLVKFHSRLDLVGSDFQKRVWKELMNVRYGQTTTYRDLATNVGSPGAAQAVGRANGENPLPIVIPCHRVLGSDEGLCGYAAGIKTKEFLLRLEGAILL
jgi:methylated-DNA-[protein]-cysteine S-methyltransferase